MLRAQRISKLFQEDVTNAGHILAATYGRVTAADDHLPIRRFAFAVLLFLPSLSLSLSVSKRATDNRTATKYSRKKVTLGNGDRVRRPATVTVPAVDNVAVRSVDLHTVAVSPFYTLSRFTLTAGSSWQIMNNSWRRQLCQERFRGIPKITIAR